MIKKTIILDNIGEGTRVDALKRKAKVIGEIAKHSAIAVMEDGRTHSVAGGIALMQGLKYNGNLKNGIKGGLAVYGVLIGINTVQNIVINKELIKNA